ncbi:MAG: antitoxin [Syntrophorhabdaceae bacterium]|nr:antitoxin [Syntrophorhabdaceae bacterium]
MDKAKIFKNGQSQAVRLPKEYRFEGNQVYIKKIGNLVILIPHEKFWESFVDGLNKFTEDFMNAREQPTLESRDNL